MVEVRLITRDEIAAFIRVHSMVYGSHPSDTYLRQANERFDEQRDIGAFEDGRLIASSVIHNLRLTVPGGSMWPTGGVTNVAVMPTHRRRGVLTGLMRDHLTRLHADGTAFAVLWASESPIYNRFGYGLSTWTERWSLEQPRTALLTQPPALGRIEFVDADTARAEWPDVMARAMAGRAGFFSRTRSQWEAFHEDEPEQRDGGSAYFHAAYRVDGRTEGYATYRVQRHRVNRMVANEIRVRELMSVSDDAYRALWHFILGIDLVGEITTDLRPPDDALPWMLADTRRLQRNVQDGMWLRLVDVQAALVARAYTTTDSFVLEVRDDFCEWNARRVRLDVSPSGAQCSPTTDAADLTVEAWALAAAYLGGTPLHTLARARGVEELTPGALHRASTAFATPGAPWSPVFF